MSTYQLSHPSNGAITSVQNLPRYTYNLYSYLHWGQIPPRGDLQLESYIGDLQLESHTGDLQLESHIGG